MQVKKFVFFLQLIFVRTIIAFGHQYTPDTTVVFIIDQLPYSVIKYMPHLKGGIKELFNNGIVYHNATHAHGMPTTPTGHAAIATGCTANLHGFNSYGFVNDKNVFVEITEDHDESTFVFNDDGSLQRIGRSPKYLTTETVSDQFVLSSRNSEKPKCHEAVSFSIKPRASIPLAGNLGIAFWFDNGILTTSKFYCNNIPDWLKKFNQKNKIKIGSKYLWKYRNNPLAACYNYPEIKNYEYSNIKAEKCNKGIIRNVIIDGKEKDPYAVFMRSPFASKFLFAAAKSYIRRKQGKKLLVYISLSNYDFSGHQLGPDNIEQIDLLYHLDRQIGDMMSFVNSCRPSKKNLFIFTSDHGVSQIPEILNKHGLKSACRIDAKEIIQEINSMAEREFGYSNIIQHFEAPQIFLDKIVLEKMSEIKKNLLYQKIKNLLLAKPYILNVWSDLDFEKGHSGDLLNSDLRNLFVNQYVRGQSGNIVYLTYPNKMVTAYPVGTSHNTPYRYDTHVPLIIYQRLRFEKKQVYEPVSMLSLATTQSFLMGILPPSTAVTEYLPGIKLIQNN